MNREALEALREKVEAGSCDFDWGFAASPSRKALPEQWHNAMNAYIGSLDAAKALHEALFPKHQWSVWQGSNGDYGAVLAPFVLPKDFADNPARAWLLAILSALLAEGGE